MARSCDATTMTEGTSSLSVTSSSQTGSLMSSFYCACQPGSKYLVFRDCSTKPAANWKSQYPVMAVSRGYKQVSLLGQVTLSHACWSAVEASHSVFNSPNQLSHSYISQQWRPCLICPITLHIAMANSRGHSIFPFNSPRHVIHTHVYQ